MSDMLNDHDRRGSTGKVAAMKTSDVCKMGDFHVRLMPVLLCTLCEHLGERRCMSQLGDRTGVYVLHSKVGVIYPDMYPPLLT